MTHLETGDAPHALDGIASREPDLDLEGQLCEPVQRTRGQLRQGARAVPIHTHTHTHTQSDTITITITNNSTCNCSGQGDTHTHVAAAAKKTPTQARRAHMERKEMQTPKHLPAHNLQTACPPYPSPRGYSQGSTTALGRA